MGIQNKQLNAFIARNILLLLSIKVDYKSKLSIESNLVIPRIIASKGTPVYVKTTKTTLYHPLSQNR